jgi:hypothetical protein
MYINTKMIPVDTILGMGVGRIKDSGGGSEAKYDIFYTF